LVSEELFPTHRGEFHVDGVNPMDAIISPFELTSKAMQYKYESSLTSFYDHELLLFQLESSSNSSFSIKTSQIPPHAK
jgi:hypothetical protein